MATIQPTFTVTSTQAIITTDEQRRIEALEKRIADLEARLARLTEPSTASAEPGLLKIVSQDIQWGER